jgi:hypothetical protein
MQLGLGERESGRKDPRLAIEHFEVAGRTAAVPHARQPVYVFRSTCQLLLLGSATS